MGIDDCAELHSDQVSQPIHVQIQVFVSHIHPFCKRTMNIYFKLTLYILAVAEN